MTKFETVFYRGIFDKIKNGTIGEEELFGMAELYLKKRLNDNQKEYIRQALLKIRNEELTMEQAVELYQSKRKSYAQMY